MTSYFHNGTSHGDAIEAPYSADVFVSLLDALYPDCVIWNASYNDLLVTTVAGRNVRVRSGVAILNGGIYINDSDKTLALNENTSGYARFDMVILRHIRCEVNEIRLAIKQGIPSPYPQAPILDDNEMALAVVYVASGFAAIAATEIYDLRVFGYNSDHARHFYSDNIMVNSEFMAFSTLSTANNPPDYWSETGSVTFGEYIKPDQQARGRAVTLDCNVAGEGISTTLLTTQGTAKMFTLQALVKVNSGICQVSWAGTTRNLYPTLEYEEVIIRVSTNSYQTLSFLSSGGAANFEIGQIILTQGYIQLPFEPNHETLFFMTSLTPYLSWTSQSSGIKTVSIDSFVNNGLLEGTLMGLVQVHVNDAGSAGAGPYYAELASISGGVWCRVYVHGLTNDALRTGFGIIYFEPPDFKGELTLVASGVGTMDARLYLTGIVV